MKQNKTILFLTRLYHPHIGGVEKHVEELVVGLSAKGFRVTILTEKYRNDLPGEETIGTVKVIRIPIGENAFLKKFYVWKWMLAHVGILRDADIIHAHDVFFWILPLRPLLFFKKVYTTFHGYEGYPVKNRRRLIRKLSERLSNGSICVGNFMKKWYFADPDSIIYGGVRPAKQNTAKNAQSAVFFGRLDDQTGIKEYIEAYALIKKKYPRFKLTVVGEGQLKPQIPSDVVIIPFKKNIEKYISVNRFIFVSRYLSMLEALVQKREVVAVYDNPIKRDYLIDSPFNKYVHIAKNSEEIAQIVINSLKNPKTGEKMTESGYLWAKKQTWENVTNTYLRLWGLLKN